jgi:hypothetical protein
VFSSEVSTVFLLVGYSSERDINMFASDPLVKVIFDLKKGLINKNNRKLKLTNVSAKAMVAVDSKPFSENSGCITPLLSLFLNQTLLIIFCMSGARNMPVFNVGS